MEQDLKQAKLPDIARTSSKEGLQHLGTGMTVRLHHHRRCVATSNSSDNVAACGAIMPGLAHACVLFLLSSIGKLLFCLLALLMK